TLIPLDWQTITSSIQKTGRALVLYEAPRTGAFGAEIAARISEECFSYLDAPVMRCASMDTPIPFNSKLEEQYLAKSRLAETVAALQAY
ncbi:MAG: hypothetical protein KDD62_15930, partial [Bdellovibrionales bacterium]|nr:hypothetical protein [Bdellovibrionales bacterium]